MGKDAPTYRSARGGDVRIALDLISKTCTTFWSLRGKHVLCQTRTFGPK